MSDEPLVLDESLIEWETLKSKNGASFRVGREKTDGVKGDDIKAVAAKEDFGISVIWPVSRYWVKTPDDVEKTAAITDYRLCECYDIWAGKYCLQFTNTEHYNYYFFDETGDSYQVNTWLNSTHYVRYDSTKPTIIYITGS